MVDIPYPFNDHVPPNQPTRHKYVVFGIFAMVTVAMAVFNAASSQNDLIDLYKALNEDDRFFLVQVSQYGDRLEIQAWDDEDCDIVTCDAMIMDLARITMAEYEAIDDIESLTITIFKKIDLGVAFMAQELYTASAPLTTWSGIRQAEELYEQGVVYSENGDYETAIEMYTRVIALAPDAFNAYGNRGIAYMNLGDYQYALQDLYTYSDLMRKYGMKIETEIAAMIAELEALVGNTE